MSSDTGKPVQYQKPSSATSAASGPRVKRGLIATRQRSCGKVMFSQVSVILLGVTCDPVMHWTSLYRAPARPSRHETRRPPHLEAMSFSVSLSLSLQYK